MSLENKLYAEQNAGRRGIYQGAEIEIVGWQKRLDGEGGGYDVVIDKLKLNSNKYDYHRTQRLWLYKETIYGYLDVANPEYIVLNPLPEKETAPDDCLVCGAKGVEPCKNDCPNRE